MVKYDNEYNAICSRIFELLEEKDLSQKELAKRLGVLPQTITDWKKGKSRSFTSMIGSLADALDTTPIWLYAGEGRRYMSKEEKKQDSDMKLAALKEAFFKQSPKKNSIFYVHPDFLIKFNSLSTDDQEEIIAIIEMKLAKYLQKDDGMKTEKESE